MIENEIKRKAFDDINITIEKLIRESETELVKWKYDYTKQCILKNHIALIRENEQYFDPKELGCMDIYNPEVIVENLAMKIKHLEERIDFLYDLKDEIKEDII